MLNLGTFCLAIMLEITPIFGMKKGIYLCLPAQRVPVAIVVHTEFWLANESTYQRASLCSSAFPDNIRQGPSRPTRLRETSARCPRVWRQYGRTEAARGISLSQANIRGVVPRSEIYTRVLMLLSRRNGWSSAILWFSLTRQVRILGIQGVLRILLIR